jgi:hypothetical protein
MRKLECDIEMVHGGHKHVASEGEIPDEFHSKSMKNAPGESIMDDLTSGDGSSIAKIPAQARYVKIKTRDSSREPFWNIMVKLIFFD